MSSYILPNRKAFADSVTRIFKIHRAKDTGPVDDEDKNVDLCSVRTGPGRELLPYQKLVRDYLLAESPYRGLLVYHGLGSGKTCSAIAVAESLMSTHKIFVMLPASLQDNFKGELRKCGDPFYQEEQHWDVRNIRQHQDIEHARSLGISQKFLDKQMRYFVTVPGRPANFKDQPADIRKGISEQISDVIDQRFTFINYNGINKSNIDEIFPPDQSDQFDNSVVIIDEAHNFIGNVVNESVSKMKIYDRLYQAKNAKMVLLSGTPIINSPNEIAFLLNLVRGPIERVSIPTTQVISWDEGMMTTFFRSIPEIDTVEYNSVKKVIMLTRNPPQFESVYNEKKERIAVKFNKELVFERDILKWTESWRKEFSEKFPGTDLAESDKCKKEDLECLPTKYEEFMSTYIEGLKVKNAFMFQKRIQGLVSYFKGSDERLLPKRIDQQHELVKIEMSDQQFLRYLEVRWAEIKIDSRRGRNPGLDEDMGSYRANSRLVCNYAVPPEFKGDDEEIKDENFTSLKKEEILEKIKANPKRFLSDESLNSFSRKFLEMIKNVREAMGQPPYNNQFIYSNYKSLEGSGIFGAILEQNGFQEYKIIKVQGRYIEDPDLKPDVPAFMYYTGDEGVTSEKRTQRDYCRQIFNGPDSDGKYEADFPSTLKDSIKTRVCIFLGSSSAAEGITLKNVRNVHITESHWNPARLDQVIGRAIRICSHATLPMEERTVKVKTYLSIFSKEQQTGTEGPNIVLIRRNDMTLKRYDVEQPIEAFMTTDEYLYEKSYEKERINMSIITLLKQAAIDCEIHRKLHSKNGEVIQCMRFDTTAKPEDIAYNPSSKNDDPDIFFKRNMERKKRRLQFIRVKGFDMLMDPDTMEIFDASAFEDNKRLLKLGIKTSITEIKWFSP
jgi:hypothetical protein